MRPVSQPKQRVHLIQHRLFNSNLHGSPDKLMLGRTALVTGSTKGIGLCVAQSLASKGCKVAINGFGDIQNALHEVRSSALESNKNDIHHIDADLSQKDEAIGLVKECVHVLGSDSLDIVVNNAGLIHVASIETFDDDAYLSEINIMLNAPFFITKTVLPIMRRNGFGRIINIASAHGLRASPLKGPYCIAKHGVVGLTKAVALEMALENQINWTSNAICPGYVRTHLATDQIYTNIETSGKTYEEEEYELIHKNATAQWIEPSNIAAMVQFLCTDDARQITGSAWSIDGGWTAR
eukprot:315242_1